MSCNGCRVLRKGCSETCILRPCLQWIETPEAQGHATVFVAKFFGRAGLMSFISAVPENQRPALFQSLLYEACGRTVNPVNGAVGLLWTGNWHVTQAAVETVLRGGTLRAMPELINANGTAGLPNILSSDETSDAGCTDMPRFHQQSHVNRQPSCRFTNSRSNVSPKRKNQNPADLDLSLVSKMPRPGTPSMNSEESVTTTCFDGGLGDQYGYEGERKLLNLFV
ncbi:hypothetical protein ACFE04_023549 [Oxalis oulophora]